MLVTAGRFFNFIFTAFFFHCLFAAEEAPQSFTLDGRLYSDSAATTPLVDIVSMKLQILNPSQNCILYEETQNIDTRSTSGYYTIEVGQKASPPAGKRTSGDSNNTLVTTFSNTSSSVNGKLLSDGTTSCTYNPTAGDTRYVKFTMTPSGDGVPRTTTTNLRLDSVPSALVAERAESLRGYTPSQFLQVNTTTASLSQANLESLFSTTNYSRMSSLVSVPVTDYVTKSSNGSIGIPSVASDPATTLAGGQIWYNSTSNTFKYYDAGSSSVKTIANSGSTSQWTTTGSDIYYNTGNVGVGTTSPGAKLHAIVASEGADGLNVSSSTGSIILRPDGTNGNVIRFGGSGGSADTLKFLGPSDGEYFRVNSSIMTIQPNTNIVGGSLMLNGSTGLSRAASTLAVNNTSSTNSDVRIYTSSAMAAVERMRIDTNGNVGVGIANPLDNLHVLGGIRAGNGLGNANFTLDVGNGAGDGKIIFAGGGTGNPSYDLTMPVADHNNFEIGFTKSASRNVRMKIDGNGNVGIGTTLPSTPLQISNANPMIRLENSAGGGTTAGLKYTVGGTEKSFVKLADSTVNIGGGDSGWPTGNVISINTAGHAYGDYLLNMSSNPTKLAFRNFTAGWGYASIQAGHKAGGSSQQYLSMGPDAFPELLMMDYTGNVGIGTTSPDSKLQVDGHIWPETNASSSLGSSSLRWNNIYLSNAPDVSSDARIKKNIQDSDLGLNFINSLRPVSWTWKDHRQGSSMHYGVIAQEAEEAINSAKGKQVSNVIVSHDQATDSYSVRYTELISPLIKAIQELLKIILGEKTTNSIQSQEITALKKENNELKFQLNQQRIEINMQQKELEKIKQRLGISQ